MPWTKVPWTVWTALLLLDAACIVAIGTMMSASVSQWLLLALSLIGMNLELIRGREWVRQLLTLVGAVGTGMAFLVPGVWTRLALLAPVVAAVLLYTSPSRHWFKAAAELDRTLPRPLWLRLVRHVYCLVLATPFIFAALCCLVVLPEIPGTRKFQRLAAYSDLSALLAAERTEVSRVVPFEQNGTNYAAAVLTRMGFLPSGPAVFIYDANGRLIDRCQDSGDNPRFLRRWDYR